MCVFGFAGNYTLWRLTFTQSYFPFRSIFCCGAAESALASFPETGGEYKFKGPKTNSPLFRYVLRNHHVSNQLEGQILIAPAFSIALYR